MPPGPFDFPPPRKLIAITSNPAFTSTGACFAQLSLFQRPPCASSTARSPAPYTSAYTKPPSSVAKLTVVGAASAASATGTTPLNPSPATNAIKALMPTLYYAPACVFVRSLSVARLLSEEATAASSRRCGLHPQWAACSADTDKFGDRPGNCQAAW